MEVRGEGVWRGSVRGGKMSGREGRGENPCRHEDSDVANGTSKGSEIRVDVVH